jgi:hypothetical protein
MIIVGAENKTVSEDAEASDYNLIIDYRFEPALASI